MHGVQKLSSLRAERSNLGCLNRKEYPVMEKHYYVYIQTNKNNTVLYTGVTSDLKKRCYEHKEKLVEGVSPQKL